MQKKSLDKNQGNTWQPQKRGASMLLSTERAPINPHCCGFKSQAPENGHHA